MLKKLCVLFLLCLFFYSCESAVAPENTVVEVEIQNGDNGGGSTGEPDGSGKGGG